MSRRVPATRGPDPVVQLFGIGAEPRGISDFWRWSFADDNLGMAGIHSETSVGALSMVTLLKSEFGDGAVQGVAG